MSNDLDVILPNISPSDHPEHDALYWSKIEIEAIRDYARDAILADRERTASRIRELEADVKAMTSFADLWYYVMDEAPGEFEVIVTTCASNEWMGRIAAHKQGRTYGQ